MRQGLGKGGAVIGINDKSRVRLRRFFYEFFLSVINGYFASASSVGVVRAYFRSRLYNAVGHDSAFGNNGNMGGVVLLRVQPQIVCGKPFRKSFVLNIVAPRKYFESVANINPERRRHGLLLLFQFARSVKFQRYQLLFGFCKVGLVFGGGKVRANAF